MPASHINVPSDMRRKDMLISTEGQGRAESGASPNCMARGQYRSRSWHAQQPRVVVDESAAEVHMTCSATPNTHAGVISYNASCGAAENLIEGLLSVRVKSQFAPLSRPRAPLHRRAPARS
jgi:hypothetical protein